MNKCLKGFAMAVSIFLLTAAGDDADSPRYSASGALAFPQNYREWVYLSSGLDMSYSAQAATMDHSTMDHSMFDNVFVNPAAWAAFKQSGHWPDKTVFAMEIRLAGTRGSINQAGHYQTEERMGVEFHVHDESRFKGGWAFFATDGTQSAEILPESATCTACHQAHGAVDSTFTQFYPTAKPVAVKAGTFQER
jgi:hypothetical protein